MTSEELALVIKKVSKRLGIEKNPAEVAKMVSRHVGGPSVEAQVEEVVRVVKVESDLKAKQFIPADDKNRTRGSREACRLLINELKDELSCPEVVSPKLSDDGATIVLFLSDTHFGEVIRANGRNTYDFDIAETRIQRIFDQVASSPELRGYGVDNLVVVLGGDIVDGELIYPQQAFANEGEGVLFGQIAPAAKILFREITRLSAKLGCPVDVYCVPGNHGRVSKLNHVLSNWDNVLYFMLKLMSEQLDGSVSIHTPHQTWMDFRLRERWNVHARHIGVPQTVTAGPGRKVANWMTLHQADLFLFGHFHTPEMFSLGHRRVFKNGCLSSLSEFGEDHGFLPGEGQWMFVTTNRQMVAFSKVLDPTDGDFDVE